MPPANLAPATDAADATDALDSEPTRVQSLPPEPSGFEGSAVLPRGTRVGDYEVERKIGEGAMGAVYRAVHPAINKCVAIKIMNPRLCRDRGAIERFTREARAVAALRHPGIVDVFSFGTLDDGRAYLIMEWLEGTSLRARIEHGELLLDEALDTLDQICRALAAAHDKGIIHRDLKPDNIYLEAIANEKPTVKLLDFGLAKLVEDDGLVATTQSGQLLGTPLYMSPEQCKAKGVDHRTDIYALGCIGYELTCGRLPFLADNYAELVAAHLSEPPPRARALRPDLPLELDELLVSMLAKEAASRPTLAKARQVIAELRGQRVEAPVSVVSVDAPSAITPAPSRRWLLVAGGFVMGGVVAVVVWQLGASRDVPPQLPPPASSTRLADPANVDASVISNTEVDASVEDASLAIDQQPEPRPNRTRPTPPTRGNQDNPVVKRPTPPLPKKDDAPDGSGSGSGSARFDRGD